MKENNLAIQAEKENAVMISEVMKETPQLYVTMKPTHNTTEELAEELAMEIVHSETGTYEPVYQRVLRMITEHDKRTHNLALSQVLEKLEEKKFTEQQVEKQQEMGEWNCYSREEYNEALDDAKSIITSLQKE